MTALCVHIKPVSVWLASHTVGQECVMNPYERLHGRLVSVKRGLTVVSTLCIKQGQALITGQCKTQTVD